MQSIRALLGRPPSSDPNNSSMDSDLGERGTTSSSSAVPKSIRSYRYDVFISFRGSDARNTFVDHLYAHFIRKGVFAFKDDTRLQKGEPISSQLVQAIKDSRASIVVFTENYAASTWCLDEMAAIAQCHTELKQHVFSVFHVDPSHVRHHNGVYKSAFNLHTRKNPGKVDGWKRAMTTFAGSVGWDVRNKPEFAEIEDIVKKVVKVLGHKFSGLTDGLIGIQPRVEALESFLKLTSPDEDDGFRVLGIQGMSGIGKTTLAKGLYDRISYQFDTCCFIENVSKIYKDGGGRNGGATAVQKEILRQTIDDKNVDSYSPLQISGTVRNRLHNIKLLVVLDGVNQYEQLKELHINPKLLRAGSRIIITTEDEHILKVYGVDNQLMSDNNVDKLQCGKAFKIYKAQEMNFNHAQELLCQKASISDDSRRKAFAEPILEVLKYVQGHPLAITVIGSFLCTRNAQQWRATLARWRNNPPRMIMEVLRVSYDEGLEQEEKEIFLHVACFFKGERKDYVTRILEACGLNPDIGIPVIAEKSLITIRNHEIHMHEMLQELGKKIVRGQHPKKPEFWSRLWLCDDFHLATMANTKALEVEAIVLDQEEDVFKLSELRDEDLPKMPNLKMLIILHHTNISVMRKFLSNSLCYLSWNGYPFTYLPSIFQPRHHLVELNIPNSCIEQLWIDMHQNLPNLKRMDLSNSKNLKMTPSFSGVPNLERLDLTGCIKLWRVDPSIGLLKKLVFLSLQNCSSLVSLSFHHAPRLRSLVCLSFRSESTLNSLKVLRLCGCTQLRKTPNFTGASNLEYLDMDGCTSLSTIHESVGALKRLRFLSLRQCTNLVGMPDSFNNMRSLITLDLCGCSKLKNLPLVRISDDYSPFLGSLIFLDLSFCKISKVPDAIGELSCLERLNLRGNNFSTLPSTIKRLYSLAYLNLSHCHELRDWPALPTESAPPDSVGRYFKTTSGSRDHRSGLYAFDCPLVWKCNATVLFEWLQRLVKEPRHFRCGFDIVLPWNWKRNDFKVIPQWFERSHRFKGGSIVRIKHYSNMDVDWVGFVFCVAFEVNNHAIVSGSPHPFYLSFEREYTEEHFDMPLSLERGKCDGSRYLWTIYISREHCHFVNTGAHITFKACRGLIMKEWGLRMLTTEDAEGLQWTPRTQFPLVEVIGSGDHQEISNCFEHKIQLPYNWLVSNEDEVENDEAKRKETNLTNLGLLTGDLQY